MTEQQARSTVGGIALVLAATIAALAWGRAAVDVVLVVARVCGLERHTLPVPSPRSPAQPAQDGETER